jgi:hypothetical protein
MQPWKVCRQMVAESHHFDGDPDPHQSENSDRYAHQSKKLDLHGFASELRICNRVLNDLQRARLSCGGMIWLLASPVN